LKNVENLQKQQCEGYCGETGFGDAMVVQVDNVYFRFGVKPASA